MDIDIFFDKHLQKMINFKQHTSKVISGTMFLVHVYIYGPTQPIRNILLRLHGLDYF